MIYDNVSYVKHMLDNLESEMRSIPIIKDVSVSKEDLPPAILKEVNSFLLEDEDLEVSFKLARSKIGQKSGIYVNGTRWVESSLRNRMLILYFTSMLIPKMMEEGAFIYKLSLRAISLGEESLRLLEKDK